MARKNCPVCGGVLRTRTDGGCTKCENRHWYRRLWRSIRRNWVLLLAIGLILAAFIFGPQARIAQLEETVAELEGTVARQAEQIAEQEAENQEFKEQVADLGQVVAENTAAREELQRLLEELLADKGQWQSCRTEFDGFVCSGWIPPDSDVCLIETCQPVSLPEQATVTVEQGDTVWDLLTEELGRYPTWEEIQKVVDANGLENFMDGQGLWIVLIYPGQVLDLSPALGP